MGGGDRGGGGDDRGDGGNGGVVELTRSLTLLLKFIVQREVVALSRKHKTC